MLPPSLYTPLYHHVMLLVVLGCALLYWTEQPQAKGLARFNQVAMVVLGVGVLLFMGLRPVSGVFVDMLHYARSYESVQQGAEGTYTDVLFNLLMRLCAPVLSVEGFFFIITLIYIAPLTLASWRIHGAWAFPVFLACVTAFSFWAYGVNGIRNGMATSVLLLAFAFHDKPVVMFPLMAAAWGFHGATLLPAGAFLVVRYVKKTEFWLAFWGVCVAASLFGGNVGGMLLNRYNPFAWDERIDQYILNSEGSGFRADFLAYSILPVLATLLMAAPTRGRLQRSVSRVMGGSAMTWIRNRSAMTAKRMGMGRRRLAWQHGASQVGGAACVRLAPVSRQARSAAEPQPASFGVRRLLGALGRQDWSRRGGRRVARGKSGDQLPHSKAFSVRKDSEVLQCNGLEGTWTKLSGQAVSVPHGMMTQTGWGSLPYVRMLRSDPFYARLVNTYLLTNALWVLAIHANFSNRFAYLSWFMMPWILLYPFIPGKSIHRPRTGLIAAILFVHYLFTYFMWTVVYRMRFGV